MIKRLKNLSATGSVDQVLKKVATQQAKEMLVVRASVWLIPLCTDYWATQT